jgi:hypothetical protein
MKRNLIVLSCAILGLSSAMAVTTEGADTTSNTPITGMSMKTSHPCKNIGTACKAGMKDKTSAELYANCVKPILAGQPVVGVSVDPADVQACKARMDEMQKVMHKTK